MSVSPQNFNIARSYNHFSLILGKIARSKTTQFPPCNNNSFELFQRQKWNEHRANRSERGSVGYGGLLWNL